MGFLGLVIQYQGDYEWVMKFFCCDYEIMEELGDKQGIVIVLGFIGDLFKFKGDFYFVIEYMQKNLMMCEELGYQKGIVKVVNILGDIFYFIGEYECSFYFYDWVIEVMCKINYKIVFCVSFIEKGLVFIKMCKVVELLKVECEVLVFVCEFGNLDLIFDVCVLEICVLYMYGCINEVLFLFDELIQ